MESASPAPGPACSGHPDRPASWFCPACGKALCDRCVHTFPSSEGIFASCKVCGGRCDSFLTKAPVEGFRGVPSETAQERSRRIQRDQIWPAWTLGAGCLGYLLLFTPALGWVTPVYLVVWLAVGTFAVGVAGFATERLLGIGFDVSVQDSIKVAALAMAVHTVRMACLRITGVADLLGGDFVIAATGALAALVPLSISFVLIPIVVVWVAVEAFFQADLTQKIGLVMLVYLATSVLYTIAKIAGLPG